MNAAREHLEHVLSHHRDSPPDGCHHYESLIDATGRVPESRRAGGGTDGPFDMTILISFSRGRRALTGKRVAACGAADTALSSA